MWRKNDVCLEWFVPVKRNHVCLHDNHANRKERLIMYYEKISGIEINTLHFHRHRSNSSYSS